MNPSTLTLRTLKELLKWKAHPHRPAKNKFGLLLLDDGTKEFIVVPKPRAIYRSQLKQWVYDRLDSYQMIGCLSEVDMSEVEHWNTKSKPKSAWEAL